MRCLQLLVLLNLASCGQGIDPSKLRPDLHAPDAAISCPGLTTVPMTATQSSAGQWTVAVPSAARYVEFPIKAGAAGQAAAAVDWDEQDARSDLAGLVIARPATSATPTGEMQQILAAIAREEWVKSASLISSGQVSVTADGAPMIAGALLDLRLSSNSALYRVRNPLYLLLLGLDSDQLPDLPKTPIATSDAFVIQLSAIHRGGQATIVGGVATRDSYQNRLGKTRVRAADLANATAIAPSGATLHATCQTLTVASGRTADLLWVVNGSDATSDARVRLHQSAVALWNRGRSTGVDVRMAVLAMGQGASVELCQPKDCHGPMFPSTDEGLACFQECLLNPASGTGSIVDSADGIESSRRALLALLPRADDPAHLRPTARVAVIYATDVEDVGAAALFGGTLPSPLSATDAERLDAYLRPLLDLVHGEENSHNVIPPTAQAADLAGTRLHALVPYPIVESGKSCGKRQGLALVRLVQSAEGSFGSLCLDELDLTLEQLIEDLTTRAAGLTLQRVPISSSLAAALNSEEIYRSARKGFDYAVTTNSLVLYELAAQLLPQGNTVAVGYVNW
jgi:hypothetical protein